VVKVGDKIQVEIREVDDRGKLSLVPVEVVEREAAEGVSSDEGGPPGRDRGDPDDRQGAPGQGGDRDGHRTRHRERRHRDS
jgi:polyribonucleotide nucleotidyltransferase